MENIVKIWTVKPEHRHPLFLQIASDMKRTLGEFNRPIEDVLELCKQRISGMTNLKCGRGDCHVWISMENNVRIIIIS